MIQTNNHFFSNTRTYDKIEETIFSALDPLSINNKEIMDMKTEMKKQCQISSLSALSILNYQFIDDLHDPSQWSFYPSLRLLEFLFNVDPKKPYDKTGHSNYNYFEKVLSSLEDVANHHEPELYDHINSTLEQIIEDSTAELLILSATNAIPYSNLKSLAS